MTADETGRDEEMDEPNVDLTSDAETEANEEAALDQIQTLLQVVCNGLGISADIEVVDDGETIHANIEGEDLGLFIGRHGQTIDAVQHLAYKVAGRLLTPAPRVIVDASGYRERRESLLRHQADRAASEALKEKRAVSLPPMSAVDRKVVHEYLKGNPGVETFSEGEEPRRYLVVAPL